MTLKKDAFTLSPSLGSVLAPQTEAVPFAEFAERLPHASRFTIYFKTGGFASIPYAHVHLIEFRSGEMLVVHCSCGAVQRILIQGRQLLPIAQALCAERLSSLREDDAFSSTHNETTVFAVRFGCGEIMTEEPPEENG